MAVTELDRQADTTAIWPDGAAYVDGDYVPISEAKISVLDFGFTKSDVTYDVVHVWQGSFFRLDDHIRRFKRSVAGLRMTLPFDDAGLAEVLTQCVRRTGLRDAYVAMVLTRGMLKPGMPRHPDNCENRFIAYAIPWVWVMSPEMQERGAHLAISSVPRIAPESVDPTIKNYHWGDLTRAQFEATDRGADNAVLLDGEGYVTEGPGFNVFAVLDGTVVSPDRGALEGITRLSVLELCDELGVPAKIGRITREELLNADEVFCATTAGGVMPVSRVDGHIMGNDRPGPISTRIRDAYWARHEQGWHATPVDYG
ncbi:MAG: aminotransferase class IV [Minwuiales bacterium]|nr:aminotransferase class IV [Minwuiales bacterium]